MEFSFRAQHAYFRFIIMGETTIRALPRAIPSFGAQSKKMNPRQVMEIGLGDRVDPNVTWIKSILAELKRIRFASFRLCIRTKPITNAPMWDTTILGVQLSLMNMAMPPNIGVIVEKSVQFQMRPTPMQIWK